MRGECINSSSIIYHGGDTAASSVSQVAAASGCALRPVTVRLTAAVIYSPAHRGSVISPLGVTEAGEKDWFYSHWPCLIYYTWGNTIKYTQSEADKYKIET